MKKILFITYSLKYIGGVQRVLVSLVNELCKYYKIEILILDGNADIIYKIDPQVKIIVIDTYGETRSYKTLLFIEKYLSKIPKKQNIKSYIYQYGVYCVLKKWLVKNHENYDYIVTSWYMLSSMVSIMKVCNKKTIAWEHTNYKVGGKFWFNIMRSYYKNLKSVIYINKESGNYYENINSNSFLIYNIIGNPYESTPFINSQEKQNIITFAGRLNAEKNILELLEIFSVIDNKGWKLCIIGEGEQRAVIESFINQKNLVNSVFLMGYREVGEVCEYMKKSKIFTLTSSVEGLPLVLIEAMFCSNVLISYDCEYGPANIINEKNGFLVKLHDKETFREKLQLLIDNEDLFRKLNESSYKESQKWKKENLIEQWRTLLK